MRHPSYTKQWTWSQLLQKSCGLFRNTFRHLNGQSVSSPPSALRKSRTALSQTRSLLGHTHWIPAQSWDSRQLALSRVWNTWSAVAMPFILAALPYLGTHLLKNVHQQSYGLIKTHFSHEYKASFAELMPGFWDLWSCRERKRKWWGPCGRPGSREQEAEGPEPGTLGPEWDSWAMGTLRTFPSKFSHHPYMPIIFLNWNASHTKLVNVHVY